MDATSILAEISDKEPNLTSIALVSAVVALLAVGAGRLRWWAFWVVTLPILAFCNFGLVSDLRDPSFADALWNEMGPEYVYGQFVAVNGPIMLAAAARVVCLKKRVRATAC